MTTKIDFHRAEEDVRTARARVEEDIDALGREIHDSRAAAGPKLRHAGPFIAAGAAVIAIVAAWGGKRAVKFFVVAAAISATGVWYALKKAST